MAVGRTCVTAVGGAFVVFSATPPPVRPFRLSVCLYLNVTFTKC